MEISRLSCILTMDWLITYNIDLKMPEVFDPYLRVLHFQIKALYEFSVSPVNNYCYLLPHEKQFLQIWYMDVTPRDYNSTLWLWLWLSLTSTLLPKCPCFSNGSTPLQHYYALLMKWGYRTSLGLLFSFFFCWFIYPFTLFYVYVFIYV